MRKLVMIGIMILFAFQVYLTAAEIADIQIPESLDHTDVSLVLNGAGMISWWFFFDDYLTALYLVDRSQDSEKILRDDIPIGLRLQVVSGWLDSEELKDYIIDGFDNSTGGNTPPIRSKIERFIALFDEEIDESDFFDFIYIPSEGTKIFKNTAYLTEIKGLNFRRALFGIWLGDDPVDDDLKEEMLGL